MSASELPAAHTEVARCRRVADRTESQSCSGPASCVHSGGVHRSRYHYTPLFMWEGGQGSDMRQLLFPCPQWTKEGQQTFACTSRHHDTNRDTNPGALIWTTMDGLADVRSEIWNRKTTMDGCGRWEALSKTAGKRLSAACAGEQQHTRLMTKKMYCCPSSRSDSRYSGGACDLIYATICSATCLGDCAKSSEEIGTPKRNRSMRFKGSHFHHGCAACSPVGTWLWGRHQRLLRSRRVRGGTAPAPFIIA